MKKYAWVGNPNKILTEDFVVGKWADGSDKTVREAVEVSKSIEYVEIPAISSGRVAEIFDLACRIMVGHAQAGIKPSAKDAFEVASLAYEIKDKM